MEIKRILVAIKPAERSAALETAMSLAEKYDADLTILSVLDDVLIKAEKHVYPMGNDDATARGEIHCALERLIAVSRGDSEYAYRITTKVLDGKRESLILSESKMENVDLLVLGHRAEWRIEHLLFGRTLDHIVSKSSCAVLVVPEDGQ